MVSLKLSKDIIARAAGLTLLKYVKSMVIHFNIYHN